ncbi:MAG: ATP-binding protein [Desulfobulbaceae bacterium]|nr:ATP-binding protein [Desulfobulbaceae bacterium]
MKIAVASGKGGTGKTTIAVSLALAAEKKSQYIDCDVEEPNGHIFLEPVITSSREIELTVPAIDDEKCSYCGKCRDFCRFNAITVFGKTIMSFPELCHSCRGCFLVCPEQAVFESKRLIGVLEKGKCGNLEFVHGKLRVGEAMAVPLIHAVKKECDDKKIVIIDAPPGTSCPVVATITDADYTLLVTEATPFGLNDLQLAVGVLRKLERQFGVIINRADLGDSRTEKWCHSESIPIHMKIPFDRKIAAGYAAGIPLIEIYPAFQKKFSSLLAKLVAL